MRINPILQEKYADERTREHLLTLTANTIRALTMDAVQRANSGHPGMPMGMADAAVVLWTHFLKHNPADPQWPDRDRFVLSAGHGSMLLYSLLHLSGYDLPLEELKNFRQWGSKTPGHPEYGLTPGVEVTTGPLGQGISAAVGMAWAERHLAARYNRPQFELFNHYTYVIASDGDLMEGISHEACSLAGHWRLGRLIVLYDDNKITIDGETSLAFSEDVLQRYAAYGWHVLRVDGHDRHAVREAILEAQYVEDKPSLIACRTHIGYPAPHKQDTPEAHGAPLGEEEVKLTKIRMGWPLDPPFYVPEEVYAFMQELARYGAAEEKKWQERWVKYRAKYPEEGIQLADALAGELPVGWDADMPHFPVDKPVATRSASGKVLDALMPKVHFLVGGSADLTPSNKTKPRELQEFSFENRVGRYIHFGVREHAMGAILNGITLHGGLRGYGGTFLVFSDYMRASVRLAALMELPVIYVYTHDSIGLGEDGPTHQPVEHLASLRAMPHLAVIRPADATETVEAWRIALTRAWDKGPVALALTRQNVPVIDREVYASAEGVWKGAYILAEARAGAPEVILLATGSEVHIALEARENLENMDIPTRVVSMPCWELFEQQDTAYQAHVLPPAVKARVAIEAAVPLGWDRYVGPYGAVVGVDRFGASAPYQVLYEKFGLTPQHVTEVAQEVLQQVQ